MLKLPVQNLPDYNQNTFQIYTTKESYFLVDKIANEVNFVDSSLKLKETISIEAEDFFFGVWSQDSHTLIEKSGHNYKFFTIKNENEIILKEQIAVWDMTFWHQEVSMNNQMIKIYSGNETLLFSNALKITKSDLVSLDHINEEFLLAKEEENSKNSRDFANLRYSFGICYFNNFALGENFGGYKFQIFDCFNKNSVQEEIVISSEVCEDRCDLLCFDNGKTHLIVLNLENEVIGTIVYEDNKVLNQNRFNEKIVSLSSDFSLQATLNNDFLLLQKTTKIVSTRSLPKVLLLLTILLVMLSWNNWTEETESVTDVEQQEETEKVYEYTTFEKLK